ncbi:Glucose-repressible alcohol dehydrogenase transcriptional effector [Podospora pseudocomata]|uniref:CCR4-Not complex 3'-5'-exoribonuclease subunit Ccr4 n=1 Tax=Podospora pseudocomata TaxID=2093779 RepID=A0ABR0GR24_9PEZI|nr:Glucose-repressible alcohol dehydrogenase transcriptional effector [Podospora pseudocomata]
MADGDRHPIQAFSSPLSSNFSSSSSIANGILLNSLLSHLVTAQPTAHSKTSASLGQNLRGMYGQGPQQGHNNRLSGAPGRGQPNIPPVQYQQYNYGQQPQGHPHQHHAHHHQNLQPDPGVHGLPAGNMGHSSYSTGAHQASSPFAGGSHPSGQTATTRGGSGQAISDSWGEQLKLYKQAQEAHQTMVEQHLPHYYARAKASDNKGVVYASEGTTTTEDQEVARNRPSYTTNKLVKRQDWHNLDLSGQGVRKIARALFSYDFLVELYIASNKITVLPPDIGKLRCLKVLEASHNELHELPPEIGMCTNLQQLILFNNHITSLPYELGFLYKLEMLGLHGNPLMNGPLKDEIMNKDTKSLINSLLVDAPVPPAPAPRLPITVQDDVASSLERVSVLTWNILCERYATKQMYGYTPPSALEWDYRKQLILDEIYDRNPDIVCLQEISRNAYENEFSPSLAKHGYRGIQWSRPKVKTLPNNMVGGVDGCATFWKTDKWIVLQKEMLDYSHLTITRPDLKQNHDVYNRAMGKDNIGTIILLESRVTGSRLIVANTHLAWEPDLCDVKLLQIACLMENITRLGDKWTRTPPMAIDKKQAIQGILEEGEERQELPPPGPSQEYRNNTDIPLIICGDYNSTPSSGVYDFLATGRLSHDHPEWLGRKYGNFTRDGVEHPFSIRSAYAHLRGGPHELSFTNYTPTFREVIDYIWYSTNTLELVSLLAPPDKQALTRIPGFPYYHFPSDHIQIMAEYVIRPRKDKRAVVEPDFGPSSRRT